MNERVKILEMLQQGIISVEEAEKLLRAIDEKSEKKFKLQENSQYRYK